MSVHNLNRVVVQEHISDFRRRVRLNQYDEEAHYGLGVAYYNLGLFESAVDELATAGRLIPENPDIQVQLAVVLREMARQGDQTATSQLPSRVSSALKLDPDNQSALSMQAELLAASGKHEQAQEVASQIINRNPGKVQEIYANINEARADWLVQQGKWEEARPLITTLSAPGARRLTVSYLEQSPLPLSLSNPSEARARLVQVVIGSIIAGMFLFCVIIGVAIATSTKDIGLTALLGIIALFGVPIMFISKTNKDIQRRTIEITHEKIYSKTTSMSELMQLGDAFSQYKKGVFKTPQQIAEAQAQARSTAAIQNARRRNG